jgi:type I restriction enzyme S subunit
VIADLKPYPAMKDSGVPWLRQVPEHWKVLPNRAVFVEVNERDHPEEQMLSVTITRGVIPQQVLLADSAKKDSSKVDKSAYKLVRAGDIAYNKMRAWQGALGVSDYQGIVSPAYVVERPRDGVDSRYLHYLLRTPAFAKEAERWSYGITSDMWSLRPEHFRLIYSCLPTAAEQGAIVRFLDHVDRRIRRYIRAKQKLIKLLEEQKQAIIHSAVTRGLDPNVRLKPSGVEWLGDVPEHWEIRKLRQCGSIAGGMTPSMEMRSYWDGEIPWVTPKDMKRVAIGDSSVLPMWHFKKPRFG